MAVATAPTPTAQALPEPAPYKPTMGKAEVILSPHYPPPSEPHNPGPSPTMGKAEVMAPMSALVMPSATSATMVGAA